MSHPSFATSAEGCDVQDLNGSVSDWLAHDYFLRLPASCFCCAEQKIQDTRAQRAKVQLQVDAARQHQATARIEAQKSQDHYAAMLAERQRLEAEIGELKARNNGLRDVSQSQECCEFLCIEVLVLSCLQSKQGHS